MEEWKNNNKPMRRKSDFVAHNEEEMWAYLFTIKAFLAILFLAHTISRAGYGLIVE
jgi:hypothetical protein